MYNKDEGPVKRSSKIIRKKQDDFEIMHTVSAVDSEELQEMSNEFLEISVQSISNHFDSKSDEKREQRRRMTKIIHDRYMKQTLQEVNSDDSVLNDGEVEQMPDPLADEQADAETFVTPNKDKFEDSMER